MKANTGRTKEEGTPQRKEAERGTALGASTEEGAREIKEERKRTREGKRCGRERREEEGEELQEEREEEKEGRGEKGERSRENFWKKRLLAVFTTGQEENMCAIES